MADILGLVVRFLHIVFGIAWMGAVFYGVAVVRIVMPRVEMPARKATMKQLIPVLTQYIPGSAVLTIVTGAVLYLYLGGFNTFVLFSTTWGLVLLTALLLTVATFLFGLFVGIGTAKKILAHLNEDACGHGPEVGALQKRFNLANFTVFGLGLVIIGLMVYATRGAFG